MRQYKSQLQRRFDRLWQSLTKVSILVLLHFMVGVVILAMGIAIWLAFDQFGGWGWPVLIPTLAFVILMIECLSWYWKDSD